MGKFINKIKKLKNKIDDDKLKDVKFDYFFYGFTLSFLLFVIILFFTSPFYHNLT